MTEKSGRLIIDKDQCQACSKKVLVWTLVGNSFLVVLKLVSGVMSGSSGMIADGIQSISCVVTSIMVMVTLSWSSRERDARFPYGYEKLEILTTFVAFSVLIGIGVFIVLSGVLAILRRDFVQPDIMVLPVAGIALFATFMIQRHNFCAGEKLQSSAMIANGCHAGADVLSSGAVIGGIVLSQFGPDFAVCDKIAALIVGIVIVKDSLKHWMTSLRGMIDQIPSAGFGQDIEGWICRHYPGYRPADIKFKKTGKKFWVGISLRCSLPATVGEAVVEMRKMNESLLMHFPLIHEIDFFIDTV